MDEYPDLFLKNFSEECLEEKVKKCFVCFFIFTNEILSFGSVHLGTNGLSSLSKQVFTITLSH